MEKSRLAQHAYDERHHIIWKEAKVLQIESSYIWRKYKESAHIMCSTQPISQSSLEISPIWTPLISKEVSKIQGISA
jgi:hypothetical protein